MLYDLKSNQRVNPAKSILIGNHVWLVADSKILKGSVIGDNSIVATVGVVLNRFEDVNTIYEGIPAKKLKSNINWERQRNE